MSLCAVTGKMKHATRRAAQLHAFSLVDGRLRYTYRCEHCRAWHVTKRKVTA